MPLLVLTWNLPPPASLAAYAMQARAVWIPSVLAQPGVIEIRAFRNGSQTRPDVLATVEFRTSESLETYLSSRQYSGVIAGLRSSGCGAITAQVWDHSPIFPDRMRPDRSADAPGDIAVAAK